MSTLPDFPDEKKEKKNAAIKMAAALFVLTLLLMTAIGRSVALNEISREVSGLNREVSELRKKNRELEYELERKNDMVAFERYAVDELGMIKSPQSSESDDRNDKTE